VVLQFSCGCYADCFPIIKDSRLDTFSGVKVYNDAGRNSFFNTRQIGYIEARTFIRQRAVWYILFIGTVWGSNSFTLTYQQPAPKLDLCLLRIVWLHYLYYNKNGLLLNYNSINQLLYVGTYLHSLNWKNSPTNFQNDNGCWLSIGQYVGFIKVICI